MSTFPGLFSEIEDISVDQFDNISSTAFFLSHCHFDHMKGLHTYKFKKRLKDYPNVFLYCSPVSKLWLGNYLQGLEHKIKELPMNENTVIEVPSSAPGRSQSISVTLLPAGHCPGSVMFLFCTDVVNVLYTGDIRMKAKDVRKMKALKGLALDKVYLDTTFYEPKYGYFPSRDQSMEKLVEFCKDWLDQDEKNVIDIRKSAHIGIEYSYMTLHKLLNMSVHVSEDEWKQYSRIPDLAPAVTTDATKTRIHACVWRGSGENASNFENTHLSIETAHVRSIKLCALHATNLRPSDEILRYHEKSNIFKLVYSSHCSHDELREILAELAPRKVIPCVVPKDVSEEQILECLLPDLSDTTPVTSSFESAIDFSPMKTTVCDDQPVKNCSQSSTNSFSSTEDTVTKPKTSFLVSSQRYAVRDSSDDESSLSPPKLNKSNGLSSISKDDGEEPPWSAYMQAAKRLRREQD